MLFYMKRGNKMGQGAIFLCALLWSTSGLFIKLVDWHPLVIAGSRSFLAALVLLGVRMFRTSRTAGPAFAPAFYTIMAGFAYAATMITFVVANKHTASANAILLQYSAPIWAALLGWVIAKEQPHWEHWGALVCMAGGMLLFFKDGLAGGGFFGDSLAIFSGICFGANSVFMRMIKDGDPADGMLLSHIFTALFSIPFFFIYPPALSADPVLAIVFMGIIQIGVASLLFAYGIKRVTAIQAMLTATIEPVMNPVWVLLVTAERPSFSALVGGGIIIAAVAASSLIGRRRAAGFSVP
ncbi:membrane protein [Spirochaetia bacterium]|nr:membrane protein [Spirochaetia bacterium]